MKKSLFFIIFFSCVYTVKSQNIEFKNAYFKNVLLKVYPEIDSNKDSNISIVEANNLRKISLMEQNLTDVQDLVHFKNLEYLSLTINNIQVLKLNDFKYLKEIYCARNLLTVLEIKNLPSLIDLACGLNNLTNVNIENCPKLESLNLMDNQINTIDLSFFSKLKYLSLDENKLEHLDLSKNKDIIQINLNNNNIKELDLKNNLKLDLNICYIDDSVKLILNKKQSKLNKASLPPPVIIQH